MIASQYIYPPVPCPAIKVRFVKTISLVVYGLSAGIYSSNVNGTTGTPIAQQHYYSQNRPLNTCQP